MILTNRKYLSHIPSLSTRDHGQKKSTHLHSQHANMGEEKYSFKDLPTYPYILDKKHYTVKGTPGEVVARISTAFEGLPAQFKYEESSFSFHFYTPEKSEGYIHCFTKSDGEHVIEIMRISGQQVYFYPVLYQLLFRMGLGPEPEPQPAFNECCLFQPPVKESLICLTHMSNRYEYVRTKCLTEFYDLIVGNPALVDELEPYGVVEVILRALDGSKESETYRYAALALKILCTEPDKPRVIARFADITSKDTLSSREIKRIVNEL